MGSAGYVLALVFAFNLGFHKGEPISQSITKAPDIGVTSPGAMSESAPSGSNKPLPTSASNTTADKTPVKVEDGEAPAGSPLPEKEPARPENEAPSLPSSPVHPAANDEDPGLSAADQRILRQLKSGSPEQIRAAARRLYEQRYESPLLLDLAAEVLKGQYRNPSGSWLHVDAMAWICKALGRSGNPKYRWLLDNVSRNAPSRKLRGYAGKSSRVLQ